MFEFKIESPIKKVAKKLLHRYQARDLHQKILVLVDFVFETIWSFARVFNSPGTEIFPFSYFAFTLLKLRKLIKDIKIINIFDKTRRHAFDFGRESFYRNHGMTPVVTVFILAQRGKMSTEWTIVPGELNNFGYNL